MEIRSVSVDSITIGPRHRKVDQKKVAELADSISAVGLLQPISVHASGQIVSLVFGRHRLEAFRQLGRLQIDAVIVAGEELDRELAEIDENLVRVGLTEAEEARHLVRRKEIWEARKAKAEQVVPVSGGRGNQGFAADTAKATGQTKQSVNRKVSRGKKIAAEVLDAITGTKWDKGVNLDLLAKLNHKDQRAVWERVRSGRSSDFSDARAFVTGDEDRTPKPKASKSSAQNEPPPKPSIAISVFERCVQDVVATVSEALPAVPADQRGALFERLRDELAYLETQIVRSSPNGHHATHQSA